MASRKRKKSSPNRLSYENQQGLTWSLKDMFYIKQDGILNGLHENDRQGFSESSATTSHKFCKRAKHTTTQPRDLFIKTSLPKSWHCILGTFDLDLIDSQNLRKIDQTCCRVTIDLDQFLSNELNSSEENKDDILPDNLRGLSMEGQTVLSHDLIDAIIFLQKKDILFLVLPTNTSILDNIWSVKVCLHESALTNLQFPSQDTTIRKTDKMLKLVMEHFFESAINQDGDSIDDDEQEIMSRFDDLYKSIMEKKMTFHKILSDNTGDMSTSGSPLYCQHSDLKPTLRRYQKQAVLWMLSREKDKKTQSDIKGLHILWRKYITLDKKILFYNPYNGRMTTKQFPPPPEPCGGILADEMGLGKTVEVIACILNNPKPCETTEQLTNTLEEPHIKQPTTCITSQPMDIINMEQLPVTNTLEEPHVKQPTTCATSQPMHTINMEQLPIINTQEQTHIKQPTTCTTSQPMDTINKEQLPVTNTLEEPHVKQPTTCTTSQPMHTINMEQLPVINTQEQTHIKQPTTCTTSQPMDTINMEQLPVTNTIEEPHLKQPTTCTTSQPMDTINMEQLPVTNTLEQTHVKQPTTCTTSQPMHTINMEQLPVINTQEQTHIKQPTTCTTSQPMDTINMEQLPVTNTIEEPHLKQPTTCTTSQPMDTINMEQLPVTNTLEQTHVKQPTTCITSQPMDTINMEQLPVTNTIEEPHLKQPTTCTTSQPMDTINMKQLPVTCECICGMVQAGVYVVQCTKCLIVLHSKCVGGFKNNFLCPRCSVNRPPIPSSATLIISPETIVHQWVEEIKRHVSEGALKVMVYEGVNKKGFITPEEICDNDVILTTYSTLRAEFHHLNKEQGRNMRYQKRYMALPSPLTAINFWRICLDEAQMVETTTAKAAEMALQLHCVHRWCVTGTPIQKGLEDLYGLLLFLGLYPYCQKVWWKKLLCDPYMRGYKEPMQNALSGIFWRTAKNDVLDEIHLPSQTEHLVRLKFSPVEEHFYQRQHEECSSWAVRMLSKFDQVNAKLNSLDRHTVHMMLTPLLRLRQACCHPQAVRGGFLSIHKSTLTMDELLENLTAKAKLECEEAHRQLLFAINGLAGIHIIKEEFTIAVDLYRQSMHSWVEHEKYFRTDKLQKLHTLHNLNELLSYGSPGCSQTTADEKLADKIKDYTSEYMLKPNAQVEMAISNLDNAKKHTQELENKAEKNSPWWILAIGCVQRQRLEVELISRVKDQLSSMESSLILDSFTDLSGLQFVLTAKIDKIKSTRKDLLDVLDYLCCYPTSTMVHVTAACCLRSKEPTDDNQSNRCKFCQADGIFTDYESKLFGHQGMKGTDGQNEIAATDAHSTRNTGGLRAETDTDKVLKTVYSFIKYHGLSPDLHQSAIDHSSYMEALRKEFKILRAGWFSLRERISSMDELEMCTTRLRLANSYESVDDLETHVIPPCEVNQQRLKFSSDRFVAQSTLRKRLGQYMYLTNLSKKSSQGENPDTCPVCTKQLGKQWSVFSCGHSYCCQCVWALLHYVGTRSGQVKCPVCRALTNTAEVSYVSTNGQVSETNSVSVKGSHSTKVEAIVRTLLVIIAEDSTAKCLVFSTWQDVLELIARALLENHVSFRHVSCTKRLQANLDDFKTDSCVNVLLLPLQSGSNGLNIIEATHVLLVEPALNPAHELQAIGRVHRIGQTRPTHVHRFIIDYTVESRLHSLFHGQSSNAARKGNKDTENSLTIADLATLFNGSHSL